MHWFTRLSALVAVVFAVCVLSVSTVYAAVDIPNQPPEEPPYLGGFYVTGVCSLGVVDIYFPVGEGWCVDEYGFLFRYGSSSVTGVMFDSSGKEYTFNAPAFSNPRYRLADSSGYTYTDLYLTPSYSNVVIENSFASSYQLSETLLMCCFAACGLIFIVLISKGR